MTCGRRRPRRPSAGPRPPGPARRAGPPTTATWRRSRGCAPPGCGAPSASTPSGSRWSRRGSGPGSWQPGTGSTRSTTRCRPRSGSGSSGGSPRAPRRGRSGSRSRSRCRRPSRASRSARPGGVVLGIVLGRSRFLSDVCAPFIKAVNAIPRIILASLFIIWFGLGMQSKIATAFVLVFFAVFFNAFQGAREVDRNLVNNARILGAGRFQVLWTIVVPSATSWILASLHSAFGFAIIGAIVGEYTGADKGLGLLINHSQGTFDSAGIYAGMIIITVLALLAEYLLTLLEGRLLRWRPAASGHDVQI
ncbi:ABC transporter permease [Actinomadura madurae]|uniref:ABC transporter permease n=1 Tax=Actinomadura madurae TaxID=1993 RepID=UPI0035586519